MDGNLEIPSFRPTGNQDFIEGGSNGPSPIPPPLAELEEDVDVSRGLTESLATMEPPSGDAKENEDCGGKASGEGGDASDDGHDYNSGPPNIVVYTTNDDKYFQSNHLNLNMKNR